MQAPSAPMLIAACSYIALARAVAWIHTAIHGVADSACYRGRGVVLRSCAGVDTWSSCALVCRKVISIAEFSLPAVCMF